MNMKLGFIFLCMLFFIGVIGYSSEGPNFGTPNNNIVETCEPCSAEETLSHGAGNDGPLNAVAENWARKDGTEFKWRSTTMVKNTSNHLKGEYIFFTVYYIPRSLSN